MPDYRKRTERNISPSQINTQVPSDSTLGPVNVVVNSKRGKPACHPPLSTDETADGPVTSFVTKASQNPDGPKMPAAS
jgi:hypothetical protein